MIDILCDEDLKARQIEVEISGDREGWMNLGKIFSNPKRKSEILSDMNPDSVYPRNLNSLIIKEVSDFNKIKVYIDIDSFCLLAPTNCCLVFVYRDLK